LILLWFCADLAALAAEDTPDAAINQQLQASFLQFPFLTPPTNTQGQPKFQTLYLTNPVAIGGDNYYGFRFTVPRRTNAEDFVWAMVEPAGSFQWFMVPQTGTMKENFTKFRFASKADYLGFEPLRPLNRKRIILQSLSGHALEDGKTYLIWFNFDGETRPLSLAFTFTRLDPTTMNDLRPLEKALALNRASSPPIVNPNNHHTYILLRSATWEKSEARAVALGGHLATVRNQAEEDWLVKTFGKYGRTQRLLWIGLSDRDKKFHFTWSSGESDSFTCWAKGEPNNAGRGEDFVAIYYPNHNQHGRWNDWNDRTHDPIGLPINGVVEIIPPMAATNHVPTLAADATAITAIKNAPAPQLAASSQTLVDTAVAVQISPALIITNDSGSIKLEWSITASNYMLEATANLNQPFTMFGYSELTNPEQGIIYVTITNPLPQMFFRLRHP
jgi:hypothetical protein